MFDDVSDGEYQISAVSRQGAPKTVAASIRGDTSVVLELERADSISVEVHDHDGASMPGMWTYVTVAGRRIASMTGPGGVAVVGGLTEGEHLIEVAYPDAPGEIVASGTGFVVEGGGWVVLSLDGLVGQRPVAVGDSYLVEENAAVALDVLANDWDPDDDLDPRSLRVESPPENGSVDLAEAGLFQYAPDLGFDGTDSFVYAICDLGGLCDTASVTIEIIPVNDPPVPSDDAYSVNEDTVLVVDASGVLGNDSDVDGDSLTVEAYGQPAHGSISGAVDGSFVYTPDADYFGPDGFSYILNGSLHVSITAANGPCAGNGYGASAKRRRPVNDGKYTGCTRANHRNRDPPVRVRDASPE